MGRFQELSEFQDHPCSQSSREFSSLNVPQFNCLWYYNRVEATGNAIVTHVIAVGQVTSQAEVTNTVSGCSPPNLMWPSD